MADLAQLFAKAQEAQAKLAELQQKLAARRIEGSAGGGMVRAQVSGALRVLEISIEPTLFASGDRAMIQDLTAAAVNAAIANAQRLVQEEMQKASSGLGLPFAGGAKPA
ncbi:MAG TPA: YbaB/EbfC family nucleoid-associated protein [Myxococcota bacterium]|nr:YbaB/EbfC family nucleoid-associated protein [Myxococcota bacterium]